MTPLEFHQPVSTESIKDSPQIWVKAQDAENGELYTFAEDLSFSHPASTLKASEQSLPYYQRFLEKLGTVAILKARQLPDLFEALAVHLSDEKNFVLDAMVHIRGILRGDEFYLPFMNKKVPSDRYGTRFISVRIEGVIVASATGGDMMFNVKLLAAEANPRTGKFTIVQVIEKVSDERNILTTFVQPTQGGTISTTLGDHHDSPPLNASVSFLST